jgi:hypothetical protein
MQIRVAATARLAAMLSSSATREHPLKRLSPLQQISVALAILMVLFFFALQLPWVAAWFG